MTAILTLTTTRHYLAPQPELPDMRPKPWRDRTKVPSRAWLPGGTHRTLAASRNTPRHGLLRL